MTHSTERSTNAIYARPRHRKPIAIAASLLLALGTAGCRDRLGLDDFTAAELNNPEKRHPIEFNRQTEALFVELGGKGDGLSHRQQADVYRFVKRYRSEANGPITVSSPRSAGGHMAASHSLRDVMDTIHGFGIPERNVRISRHSDYAGGHLGAAIKIAYRRPVAVAPQCGQWPDDLGRDRERIHWENFGCSAQRNLALTVANSRDLQRPQAETPRSSERRHVTWKDYISVPKTGGSDDQGSKQGASQSAPSPGPGLQ
ncbi:MAG: CpaD family pilus assembly protein [Alphaproteobacteria bacterium]|nr:CpaD family pilus assembly protein [Alphaproteobacteria bacterium]